MSRITHTLTCPSCEGDDLQRWGKTEPDKQGKQKQRYRCNACKRVFLDSYTPEKGEIPGFLETALAMYQERSSMRGVARTLGISRNTLSVWIKKSDSSPAASRNSAPCRTWG